MLPPPGGHILTPRPVNALSYVANDTADVMDCETGRPPWGTRVSPR